ncbi:hypothetical protein POV27_14245 [Aureisphaera galaxeae]|uniref:hypothetical protein n=1 Tax=Aureisphaera galaxeae TaxID=1538023 RepID=UPI0023505E68|nr:hypothetical protein [Aureisphaera galaxeae]MDC8005218.1 hypothetical protein [Aureisphaera galaxeae]
MKRLFFYIAIIATVAACDEEGGLLIETDISNRTVTLIAPSNNSEVATNTVFFDWSAVEDATSYEFQIATPNFENPAQLLANTQDTVTSSEVALNIGTYEWRVKALNSNYETAYTTAAFQVVPVQNFPDNTVILTDPANNLAVNSATQTLQWQVVDGATLYRIQLLQNGSVVDEQTTSSTLLDVTFAEGENTWQVRAENGTENTLYSARDILIDLTAPNTPSLTAPADEAVLTTGQVSFEWTRTPISGSVETDSIYVYRDETLTDLVLKDQASAPYDATLDNNTYYWQVQAFDEAGNQSTGSSVFSFTVNQ